MACNQENAQARIFDDLLRHSLAILHFANERTAARLHDGPEGVESLSALVEVVADVEEHFTLEKRARGGERWGKLVGGLGEPELNGKRLEESQVRIGFGCRVLEESVLNT